MLVSTTLTGGGRRMAVLAHGGTDREVGCTTAACRSRLLYGGSVGLQAFAYFTDFMGDEMTEAIKFYSTKGPHGYFSNFARYQIKYKDDVWETSEHAFQAQKFDSSTHHYSDVRKAKGPMEAAKIGRDRSRPLRKDWESVKDKEMLEVLRAKFAQHEVLKKNLLATGDAELIEHTENDSYWGDGGNGKGKNMLGKLLMQVREELRAE